MPDFHLQHNDPPIFMMAEGEARERVWRLRCEPGGGAVRVIRGWKCGTRQALYDEVSAALQFPAYFGENWDALNDCVKDLMWMPAEWYLLHVDDVGRVLPDDPEGFRIFLRILRDAGRFWADLVLRGEEMVDGARNLPFNTILSGDEAGLARARAVLAEIVASER